MQSVAPNNQIKNDKLPDPDPEPDLDHEADPFGL